MKEFKAGDKVYYPLKSDKILTLLDIKDSIAFPLLALEHSFTRDGKYRSNDKSPSIFHATPENHELLEKLYGVEFEKPHAKPTSKEIVKALLARGDKCVCCWVDDYNENPTIDNTWGFIIDYDGSALPFNDSNGSGWRYATPFDPKTGEVITELPE